VEEQVGRSLAAEQYPVGVIEGFSRSIPGRGDHELLSLHFAAHAILPAGVFSRAVIAREQDFFGQADIEDLVHVFLYIHGAENQFTSV
jgi:hypothetical protein